MLYDPEQHHRRSIRLKGYDYAQEGAYFITICTHERTCLFGEVINGEMRLNEWGEIVRATWAGLPHHYPRVVLDAFVVMPNHVHGIMILDGAIAMDDDVWGWGVGAGFVRAGLKPAPTGPAPTKPAPTIGGQKRHGLPEIIRGFKTFSARRINEMRNTPGIPVWQRNYYEHVIRNDKSLNRIREYIVNNPVQWDYDRDNPCFVPK